MCEKHGVTRLFFVSFSEVKQLNLQVILDVGAMVLRILLPFYALVIVYQCFASARRHRRPEKPLVTLEVLTTGQQIPVLFWENSIGRSKGSDIRVSDISVSRDHCVLLRRKEGWFIQDIGSKFGTFVNGERSEGRTKVIIDDAITIGHTTLVLKRGEEYQERLRPSWFFSKASDKGSLKPYKLMILITFFHLFMAVEACFSNDIKDYTPLLIFAAMEITMWIFFCVSSYAFNRVNFELEALACFLSGIGIMLLVRQVVKSAIIQTVAMAIGMVLFALLVKLIENPDRVNKWRMWIMIGAGVVLAVNILIGQVKYGAGNWITIGGISVQPSEIVKIAFIFAGAATLDELQTIRNFVWFTVFSAGCVLALAIMGDFGTALIFFSTFILIACMRSGDFRTAAVLVILPIVAAIAVAIFIVGLSKSDNPNFARFKYLTSRFSAYGHVWDDPSNLGYQQVRTMSYMASGGLIGVGVGNGFLKYYPASESDLVFGLVAEEMGVVVAFAIAFAIIALAFYARAITTRSRSTFYSISACCAAGMLVIQSALNIFGPTDILPLTGVTLPFISAGGSSMISCWGLLAFIKAADERTYAAKRRTPSNALRNRGERV